MFVIMPAHYLFVEICDLMQICILKMHPKGCQLPIFIKNGGQRAQELGVMLRKLTPAWTVHIWTIHRCSVYLLFHRNDQAKKMYSGELSRDELSQQRGLS